MFLFYLKKYLYPVAIISGSIIGVGFFSLPYIAMKSGIWLMLFYFFVLSIIVLAIHLIFTEISLKTPDYKRFPGFVGHYFGKWGQLFSFCSTIISSYGVLLAYLIVGSEFLKDLLQPYFGGRYIFYILLYFLFVNLIVWFGIKAVSKAELWILFLLFLSVVFIFLKNFEFINFSNLFIPSQDFKISNLFLPYGPILFSLWGVSLIPEAEEMLKNNKKIIKKVVIVSTLVPVVFYLFFTFLVFSITGSQTTESALLGLKQVLGQNATIIIFLTGLFTTITAYIAHALTLKKVFSYDLQIKNWQAFLMTCSVPLILFLVGLNSFIGLISFIGGVLLGIDGILILLMYKKIGGKKIIIYPLTLIFLLGVIYQIIYFLK
jgi:amino acid permease